MALPPLPQLDEAACASLRELFARLDYSEARLLEVTGLESFFSSTRSAHDVMASLAEAGPCGLLARVMLFGGRVTPAELDGAISPCTVDDWVAWGLLERHPDGDDQVRSALMLYPVGRLVLLFDRPHLGDHADEDHVMSLGGGTSSMRFLVPRGAGVHALDLGTGGGSLALLTAERNAATLGVDINERAISLARINAELNGVEGVDFAVADMFALDGLASPEGYDAVYAQPPFSIRPDAGLVYRDAMGRGDDMIRDTVRVAGQCLRQGGVAVVFCNWIVPRDREVAERMAAWVEDLQCDTLVLKIRDEEPAAYAHRWLQGPSRRNAVDPDELKRWLEYFDELGAASFSTGAICLRRRRGGQPWMHFSEAPERIGAGASDDLRELFGALDVVSTTPPDALLDRAMVAAPALRIRQELAPGPGGWRVTKSTSVLTEGLMFELNHDPAVGDLLQACDGTATPSELADHIAQRHGVAPEQVRQHLVGVVPMLLSYGFLRLHGHG